MCGKRAGIADRGGGWQVACGSALIALARAVTACGDDTTSQTAGSTDAFPAYLVRGVVLQVSDDALTLHHEAIDDFVGKNGKVTGMDAMAMRFHLAAQLRPVGLVEGDKVEVRFEARNAEPRFVIKALRILPYETVIHFRAAVPADPQ